MALVLVDTLDIHDQLENVRADHARLKIFVKDYMHNEIEEQLKKDQAQLNMIREQANSPSLTQSQIDKFQNQIDKIGQSQAMISKTLDALEALE